MDKVYQISFFWIECIMVDWMIWIVFDMENGCFGVFCVVVEVIY